MRLGNKPIPAPKEIQLPSDALLSDILSPQMRLPGLRLNQTWTVPVYSPFMPDKPLEIIRATVERHGALYLERDHGGRLVRRLPR